MTTIGEGEQTVTLREGELPFTLCEGELAFTFKGCDVGKYDNGPFIRTSFQSIATGSKEGGGSKEGRGSKEGFKGS